MGFIYIFNNETEFIWALLYFIIKNLPSMQTENRAVAKKKKKKFPMIIFKNNIFSAKFHSVVQFLLKHESSWLSSLKWNSKPLKNSKGYFPLVST